MKTVATVAIAILLVLNLVALLQIARLQQQVDALHAGMEAGQVELADTMGSLQNFADKLHFAGQASNWKLADFYRHEIEEKFEEMFGHDLEEDGVQLNPLIESMILPHLGTLKSAIAAEDSTRFQTAYQNLIIGCNACHQATDHAFIIITTPERSMFQNQLFEVQQ
jgi:hypothetical protein